MVYLIFYLYSCKFKRLFSYRSKDTIPDMELHVKLGIPKERGLYQCGKNDLFAVVIAFRYLLSKQEFLEFKRVLTAQVDNFLKSTTRIFQKKNCSVQWVSLQIGRRSAFIEFDYVRRQTPP